jgi:DNA invertase Pin-like site-specific DNA recombinase
MIVGYARVSSVGQSLDVQLEKLQGCDKVFQEKASGANATRPELKKCIEFVREGDTLVVSRLDRLARSTLHLCKIGAELESKGVNLKVIDQSIDTSSATGRLLFNMLGAIAQFENEIRAERQADGIKQAKENGVKFGAKKKLTIEQAQEIRAKRQNGSTIVDLSKEFGVSRATIYRALGDAKRQAGIAAPQPEDKELSL